MADDFDPFDDIFGDEPVKNARVVGKFRPKPKFQPQRKVSAKSSVASSQAVQTVHSAPPESSGPIQTAKSLEKSSNVLPNDNTKQTGRTIDSTPSELSQPIKIAEQLKLGSDAAPNDKPDLHAKLVEENADVLIGSDAHTHFLLHTNTEGVALNALNTENIGGRLGTQVASSIEDSINSCMVADAPMDSSTDVHDDVDGRPVIEGMDVMDSINMTELSTKYGQKTGNFQSRPNLQMQKNTYDAVDLSSPGFSRTLLTESTSEFPLNEESLNLMEVPQLESCTHLESLPEVPAKLASRRAKTGHSKTNAASDPHPQQQKASTSSQENGAGRSLRPRKRDTSVHELVDEDGDETHASGEFSEERPVSPAIDEENINNEQPQVESESQKKNLKRKSKNTENDKDKPPRKSKKAKEASEQETHAKQKKFSHSTRRRRVDKNLLNIPEEEFDPSEVPLRDLILLAEHREKQKKTEQGSAGAPATHQSTGTSDYNNDPAGQYTNDGEEGTNAGDTEEYYNYQSRMEKTPRVRWSKQDTELFYEAVQQFGTDFSMIAQLFPGRIREQIRNKYKKEERQHPLRLREALTNRSKDLSHFGKVIENLNKIRAEQDELDNEDLTSTEGPDEEASNADDDEGKHERVEEEENGDVPNGFTEVQSTAKAEKDKEKEVEEEEADEEDEMLLWSQYKSAM